MHKTFPSQIRWEGSLIFTLTLKVNFSNKFRPDTKTDLAFDTMDTDETHFAHRFLLKIISKILREKYDGKSKTSYNFGI